MLPPYAVRIKRGSKSVVGRALQAGSSGVSCVPCSPFRHLAALLGRPVCEHHKLRLPLRASGRFPLRVIFIGEDVGQSK